jgi:membrane protease YdiL (CAAX protease family)
MLALLILLAIPAALWLGQTLLLLAGGRPVQWAISGDRLPPHLKTANRALLYGLLLTAIGLYPILRGEDWMDWLARLWPPGEFRDAGLGVGLALGFLLPLYVVWAATDNVRFRIRHGGGALLRRTAATPLTAVFAAAIEELLFRGVLLDDLLRLAEAAAPDETGPQAQTIPGGAAVTTGVLLAVVGGALVFAAAHYVRRVKRYWTFPGHLALGLLFCTAFAATRNLWLSFGLHAAGILIIMALRPMVRYTGPPWLVGASIFPYAGLPGVAALLALCVLLFVRMV